MRAMRDIVRAAAVAAALTLGLGVAHPARAAAASVYDVIRDCQDGVVDGRYSLKDLRRAERSLPSDQSEYSDCVDALREAQVSARERRSGGDSSGAPGGGPSGDGPPPSEGPSGQAPGGAGPPAPPPPEDVAALGDEVGKIAGQRPPEVSVGGRPLTPLAPGAATTLSAGEVVSKLPPPVLLAMLVIGGLCLLVLAVPLRSRLPGAHRLALRLRRR